MHYQYIHETITRILTLFTSNNPFHIPKIDPPPPNPHAGRNRTPSTPQTLTLDHQICNICREAGPPRHGECYTCKTMKSTKAPATFAGHTNNKLYPNQEFPTTPKARQDAVDAMEYTQELFDLEIHHEETECLINDPRPKYTVNPLDQPLPDFCNRGRGRKMYLDRLSKKTNIIMTRIQF